LARPLDPHSLGLEVVEFLSSRLFYQPIIQDLSADVVVVFTTKALVGSPYLLVNIVVVSHL
jgi:hypothetical protein